MTETEEHKSEPTEESRFRDMLIYGAAIERIHCQKSGGITVERVDPHDFYVEQTGCEEEKWDVKPLFFYGMGIVTGMLIEWVLAI
jgi:hypothetical protein